ncbi:MAG: SGNH/GDSL hydrolase family protein [Clostridiales bacterium]|nr:SGNH/GDSL hydrolase family protein [Clostridiales bacterium]
MLERHVSYYGGIKKVLLVIFFAVVITVIISSGIYMATHSDKKNVKITSIFYDSGNVNLKWKAPVDAHICTVMRKEAGRGGAFKEVAMLDGDCNEYNDSSADEKKNYIYKIVVSTRNKVIKSDEYTVSVKKYELPHLRALSYCSDSYSNTKVRLTWKAEPCSKYLIMRKKLNEKYKVVSVVIPFGNQGIYEASGLASDNRYTYTVRRFDNEGTIVSCLSPFDSEGITTINNYPSVNADFQNLKTNITWSEVKGANGYIVLRKFGLKHGYRKIGNVRTGRGNQYTDIYHKTYSKKQRKTHLCIGYYSDSSIRSNIYTVRAYTVQNGKYSYGNFLRDGDYELATPVIVSARNSETGQMSLSWTRIYNAKTYKVYNGHMDNEGHKHWNLIKTCKQRKGTLIRSNIKTNKSEPYYTVVACSKRNGKSIHSDHDSNFSTAGRKYSDQNVLFLGDSITYGSPYKSKTTKEIFSYPWRVNQLTGIHYYNPSIPGSTWAYKYETPAENKIYHRYRVVTDVADKIKDGKSPNGPRGLLHKNRQRFKDYDVVIMAAGTNDYTDDISIGSLNSTNKKEFNGALNTILKYIEEANGERKLAGKKPIKIVWLDMFYSDRIGYDYSIRQNRFTTENGIGLTLKDYQKDENKIISKYRKRGLNIYKFNTGSFVTRKSCPYVTSDNLHMTRYTYAKIGNALSGYLINNVFNK